MRRSVVISVVIASAMGCGGSNPIEPDAALPIFSADYRSTFMEVRNCRLSGDHDLNDVRMLVDPNAFDAYMLRDRPFPVGSLVIKEEFEAGDTTCSGPIKQWTVMLQLPAGSSPVTIDWHWQKVDASRTVLTEDEPRCYGCHKDCGKPPVGYAGTCAAPD